MRITGVSLFLFTLLFTFGVPLGAKYYLVDWLKKKGAEKVVIEKLGWNPFIGKVWLDGVTLARDGETLMEQASLDFKLKYGKLFSKDIALSPVTYEGLSLMLEQKPSGVWKIATVTLPAGEDSEESVDKTDTVTQEIESGKDAQQSAVSTWAFLADNVVLKDCTVRYKTPVFDYTVHVDSAELNRFSTRDGSSTGSLTLTGLINGEPVLLNLQRIQTSPALQFHGRVEVSAFDLETLDELLKDTLPFFAGISSLAGDVDFSLVNGEIDVSYDGDITVMQADVGSDSFRTRADKLNWLGKVRYQMLADAPMIVDTEGVLQGDMYSLQVPAAKLDTSEELVRLSGATNVVIGDGVQVTNDGKLEINKISFQLPVLQTTEKSLLWEGTIFYDLAKANLVETDGRLTIADIEYQMPELALQIKEENFDWQGKIHYQGKKGDENNVVATDGTLALAPFSFENGLDANKISAGAEAVTWKGIFHFAQSDTGGSRIGTDGVFSGDLVKVSLSAQELLLSQERLQLTSSTDLLLGEKVDIQGTSSLQAGEFQLTRDGEKEPLVALQQLDLQEIKGLGGGTLLADLLVARGLSARVDGIMPLDVTVPALSFKDFDTSDLQSFTLSTLTLDNPKIVSRHNGKNLLELQDVTFDTLKADVQGDASVKNLSLNQLVFLGAAKDGKERNGASLQQAKLSGIRWSLRDGLGGELLDFQGVETDIVRGKEGKINLAERMAAMQREHGGNTVASAASIAQAGKKEQEQKSYVKMQLGKVRLSGESLVVFEDHTLKVPYTTELKITEFEIEQLDSGNPDQNSPLTFAGSLEGRAPLRIEGSVSPFLDDIGLELEVELKNYPLRNLSSYTIQAIGTGLASGELQLNSSLSLEKNYLNNKNQIVLKRLKTNVISQELVAELNNQLPVPLDTALSVLRDRNENIKLAVPLKGNLDNIKVGLADVIVTALSKAVVPALTGYAVYALGPYGALAYVGMQLGQDMLKEGDVPVLFLQGETALVAEQKKSLSTVGERMKADGKKTDIQICPIVASWEFMTKEQRDAVAGSSVPVAEEEREELEALGQTRAKNVRQYLIDEYGIEKNRLLLCTTVIKKEKKMVPLVVLQK